MSQFITQVSDGRSRVTAHDLRVLGHPTEHRRQGELMLTSFTSHYAVTLCNYVSLIEGISEIHYGW